MYSVWWRRLEERGRITFPQAVRDIFCHGVIASDGVVYRDVAAWKQRGGTSVIVAAVAYDALGRMLVPKMFRRRFADRTVVLIGEDETVSLWNTADWQAHVASVEATRQRGGP